MKEKINNKKFFSNLIIAGFIFVTVGTIYLSEDLKIPERTSSELIEEIQILHKRILADNDQLTLINSKGEFRFQKNSQSDQWEFVNDNKEFKESSFINQFLNKMSEIKIKNVIESTKKNLEAFSLDRPMGQLKFYNSATKQNYIVNFGIYNSIDNSMFLTINGKKGIYHVESANASVETITLADIIETKPFNFSLNDLVNIKFYVGDSKNPVLDLSKKAEVVENASVEVWRDSKKEYTTASIEDFFNNIFALRSAKVLESKNKQQLALLNDLIKSPEYKMSVVNTKGQIDIYLIGSVIRSFKDMSLNDEPYYVIMTNLNYPVHFIKAPDLSLFNLEQLK